MLPELKEFQSLHIPLEEESIFTVLSNAYCKANRQSEVASNVSKMEIIRKLRSNTSANDITQTLQEIEISAFDGEFRKQFAAAGGIDAIVTAMRNHQTAEAVQRNACLALRNLAWNNDENQQLIAQKGGIDSILTAMRNHQTAEDVQKWACCALHNLAWNNNENRQLIAQKGGIDAIVTAMRNHQTAEGVQYVACCALHNLAQNNENKTLIVQHGGAEAIEFAMKQYSGNSNIQEWGGQALDSLKTERHRQAMIPANFFSKLLAKGLSNDVTVPEFLETLARLISNVHEMKIFYTFLRAGVAQGILTVDRISVPLEQALMRTAETCGNEDALATFKMILNKCFVDNLLHEHTFHVMYNRAEVKRMSNAAFVLDMKAAIERNARQIECLNGTVQALKENVRVLDSNIRAVHQSLDKLKSGLRFKMKMEATVGMVGAVVNAVTMGIGGNLLQAFQRVVAHVVDYGDAAHIVKVIRTEANPQDAAELESSFEEGVNTALEVLKNASDELAQQRLEAALERDDPLIVLGITAALINPGQDATAQDGEMKEIYPDAVLSTNDEDQFELHAAVKFGDTETLRELLADTGVAKVINDTDSCERTAADLAALTGQLEMMEMIMSKGGKFSVKSKPRMKALAKKRSTNVEQYLKIVHSELDD